MDSLNFVKLSNIDCGIAVYATAIRIFGLYYVKVLGIYDRLSKESSSDIINLAGAFVANGVNQF
jgi:hypothetical protein